MLTSMIDSNIEVSSSVYRNVSVNIPNADKLTCAEIMDQMTQKLLDEVLHWNESLSCTQFWYTKQNSGEEETLTTNVDDDIRMLQQSKALYAIRFHTLHKIPRPYKRFANGQDDENIDQSYRDLAEAHPSRHPSRRRITADSEIMDQCLHMLNTRLALLERNNFTQT